MIHLLKIISEALYNTNNGLYRKGFRLLIFNKCIYYMFMRAQIKQGHKVKSTILRKQLINEFKQLGVKVIPEERIFVE